MVTSGLVVLTTACTGWSRPGDCAAALISSVICALSTARPACPASFASLEPFGTTVASTASWSISLGELVDEVLDRLLVVADLRLEVRIHVTAAGVAGDAVQDGALAAAVDRLLDHAVDVRLRVQLVGTQRVALAVVGHDDRLFERRDHLALDDLASRVGAAATDVDAADLDPRRDLVLLSIVVGPDPDGQEQTHDDQSHQGDRDLVGSVQPRAHSDAFVVPSPPPEFYGPRPPGTCPEGLSQPRLRGIRLDLRLHFRMPDAMPPTVVWT